MGQDWQLVNLDKMEVSGNLGKLGEFLFAYKIPRLLMQFFITPFPHPRPSSILVRETRPFIRSPALGRLDLPAEIIILIFENINDLTSAIFLTLTNTSLTPFGHQRVYELMCTIRWHWAGDRVVLLGDYMEDVDLPEGMITQDELKKLRTSAGYPPSVASNEDEASSSTDEDGDHEDIPTLYDISRTELFQKIETKTPHYYSQGYRRRLPHHEFRRYVALCMAHNPNVVSADSQDPGWSLCNISKRVYVRGNAISALSGEDCSGPLLELPIGFGQVLLSQICWSWDGSVSMRYQGGIHRGAWAGDRIEITTLDRFRPPLASGEWKDVSEEVLDEVVKIWDCEYEGRKPWR